MNITALVENKSLCGLKTAHGLSLYIETRKHKLLFDVGPDNTIFENSKKLGVDLSLVDTVILSHGHRDHGGALEEFLKNNQIAKIYAHRKAFDKHYSMVRSSSEDISVATGLKTHPRVVLLDGDYKIDDELWLFAVPNTEKFRSGANDTLYSGSGRDDFSHEQNLMIFDDTIALIMGCGHAGAVNILEKATTYGPRLCVGGYHLWNPTTKETVSNELLDGIAGELAKYDISYYTCHCTGQEAYDYLSERVASMNYLSCGESITI